MLVDLKSIMECTGSMLCSTSEGVAIQFDREREIIERRQFSYEISISLNEDRARIEEAGTREDEYEGHHHPISSTNFTWQYYNVTQPIEIMIIIIDKIYVLVYQI